MQQSSSYVAVPEIARGPNARKSSGIIQLDSFQDIIFEGTMSFSSYKYYIGASVYFDHIGYYSAIFSIYTTVWLTSTTTHNPLWTLLVYRGPNYIYLFNHLYGSTSFSGSYTLIYTTPTGWLYFGWYLESNIVEGNVVNSYYFSKWQLLLKMKINLLILFKHNILLKLWKEVDLVDNFWNLNWKIMNKPSF